MIGFPQASARWWPRSLVFMLLLLPLAAVRYSPSVTAAPGVPSGLSAGDWQAIQVMLPPSQQAYVKASNTGAGDNFGWSIAVSGDTVVVGATGEASAATGVDGDQADNSATNAGAAYVFVRTGASWTQQAYLKASNTGAGDEFGGSVAVSGATVVVGAWLEDSAATGVGGSQDDNSATNAGAAYVFVRSGASWTQQAYLKASNTNAFDYFGRSVAVSGDTVVVGASREASAATGVGGNQLDNTASLAGAAYGFAGTDARLYLPLLTR